MLENKWTRREDADLWLMFWGNKICYLRTDDTRANPCVRIRTQMIVSVAIYSVADAG